MDSMMFMAARDGNVEDLLNLLEEDPLILERQGTASADTPLHVAAMFGHRDFVREIIRHKTNMVDYVIELNQQGFSPIHLAAANGHVGVVKTLMEIKFELCFLKGRDGMTPLHCASVKGRAETMNLLLSASPLCAAEATEQGETALHIAVRNNRIDALRVLVEWQRRSRALGVINYRDGDGNTVLHLAAARKNHQAIELLLCCNEEAHGVVEVNAVNKRGLTALDLFMLCPCESGLIVSSEADQQRLFRGLGIRHTHVNSHQQNHNSRVQDHTAMLGDDDNWVTWRNYFKFQLDRDTPSSVREAFLVVAVLIAAATYQTGQSIPAWGELKASDLDSDKFELIRILVLFYAISNTIGFLVSLDMILVLTSKFPMCWWLVVAVHAMAINYTISIVGNSPSGSLKIASFFLCITLLLVIRLTSRCIRTRSKRRIHGSSAQRLP